MKPFPGILLAAATVLAGAASAKDAIPAPVEGSIIGAALRTPDLARADRFLTKGLGLILVRRIEFDSRAIEAIYAFPGEARRPLILLYQPAGDTRPVTHGDGFGRIVIAVRDAGALAARLAAAGYAPGGVKANPVNHMKTFWVSDPDGYRYEITELPPPP